MTVAHEHSSTDSLSGTFLASAAADLDVPVFASASVNGSQLVMRYTDADLLDATDLPAPGRFVVLVDSLPVMVVSVTVDAAAGTVSLGLATTVAAGRTVTVAYTDPSAGDDGNAIQDASGNDAATLAATAVTNNTLDPTAPAVTGVSFPPRAYYRVGHTLEFTVTFSEAVTVTGNDSSLALQIGSAARAATFVSQIANSIVYRYQVQAGDHDADGITFGALALGSSTIRDADGKHANLALPVTDTSGVRIDAVVPAIAGAVVVPADATYGVGKVLTFTVNFDEMIAVTGTGSTLGLTIGSTSRLARYVSATADSITYTYAVQAGDTDTNGIAIGGITLNGSLVRDIAGNVANLALAGHLPSTAGILVDSTAPAIIGNITVPADGTHPGGAILSFTITFDDNVTVTGNDSTLALTIGSTARSAAFHSSSANSITYRYVVQAGDVDADGITVGGISLGHSIVQDGAGNDANLSLAGHIPDTSGVMVEAVAPVVSGTATVPADGSYGNGDTLTFTIALDEDILVTGGADITLALTIGVEVRDAQLASVGSRQLAFSYTVQTGDTDTNGIAVGAISLGSSRIRDAAGNDAVLALVGHVPSTAGVLVDAIPPVFQSATANGATLLITYGDSNALDAAHVPLGTSFSVLVGGVRVAVTAVAIDATARTVALTLATPAVNGQLVMVDYTNPGNSTAIQDVLGNKAATLGSVTIVNITPPVLPPVQQPPVDEPPSTTTMIDGLLVTTTTVIDDDGTVRQVITVPVVLPGRVDDVGKDGMADIPLVPGQGGTLLEAQLPVGYGLQASGPMQLQSSVDALQDLIREIQAHAPDGGQMAAGGQQFVDGLDNGTRLLVNTITPSLAPGAGTSGSIILSGLPQPDNIATALIIDGGALPAGTGVALHDVDFAALIGALTVTGGTGSQHVWGDGAAQTIFLGEGDDELHGGGGNDSVASAGGNDRIFGDAGNDLVSGGSGNDFIDGGTGIDTVQFAGAGRTDYSFRVVDGKLVATHLTSRADGGDGGDGGDGVDVVANVEQLRFTGAAADTSTLGSAARLVEALTGAPASLATLDKLARLIEHGATLGQVAQTVYDLGGPAIAGLDDATFVARLYHNALGRDVEAAGLVFWTGHLQAGMSRVSVLLGIADSPEKLAQPQADSDFNTSDVATLVRLYSTAFGRDPDEDGLNFWIAAYEAGNSLAGIADSFMASAEAASRYGGLDDIQLVQALYRTALHRDGGSDEVQFWADELRSGHQDRGDLLLGFANSAEKIALVGVITTSIDTV